MTKLTKTQQELLDDVRDVDNVYRTAKLNLEADLRRKMEDHLATIEAERAKVVHMAFSAGIPKSRIGREGLHTTDPRTITRILERTPDLAVVAEVLSFTSPFTWADDEHTQVRIEYRNYDKKPGSEGYIQPNGTEMIEGFPGILKAVVSAAKNEYGEREVIEDGNRTPERPAMAAAGVPWARGPIYTEIDPQSGSTLPGELDEWITNNG